LSNASCKNAGYAQNAQTYASFVYKAYQKDDSKRVQVTMIHRGPGNPKELKGAKHHDPRASV
jgi:hypothetical protein